jgi:hypothetical protein
MSLEYTIFRGDANRFVVSGDVGGDSIDHGGYRTHGEAMDALRGILRDRGLLVADVMQEGAATRVTTRFTSRFSDVVIPTSTIPELSRLVDDLCVATGQPPADTVVIALGYLKFAVDAGGRGDRLAITDDALNVIQEVYIPGRADAPK